MKLMKWDKSLSTGIDSIDKQHMKLIDMLNEFYESIRSKSTKEITANLIKNMREYALFHFSYEENLLRKHGYLALEHHKSEHKKFISKVEDFENRFNSGKIVLSIEITNFLKSWLKDHIQGTDMKYSGFLISKGAN
ncbi:MAG: bacteriohemerythrin [Chlorobi bacterium]|nr:bacteriohemerythrin [Chlorobiota bacterium]